MKPIAPVPLIVIPVPPLKPMFVRAEEVETRSERLFAATNWSALDTLPRPILERAEDVEVRSDRLLAINNAPAVEVMYPLSFTNCEIDVVENPIAPVPEIAMPVPPEKPILVLAEEVEVKSERLLDAINCREFATLPRPIFERAVEVFVRSDKLFDATSWRALMTFPKPMFVLALDVELRSERLFVIRSAPAVDVIYPLSFANWEMDVVVKPIAPVPEIVIPVPPENPMFVRAEDVEVRSFKLFAATNWRALDTLPKPIFVLAVEVFVRSERLFAATSWSAFVTLPRPMFVLALDVEVRSERLLAINNAPAVEVM